MRGQKDIWKAFDGFHVLCVILISTQCGWINYLLLKKKVLNLAQGGQMKDVTGRGNAA